MPAGGRFKLSLTLIVEITLESQIWMNHTKELWIIALSVLRIKDLLQHFLSQAMKDYRSLKTDRILTRSSMENFKGFHLKILGTIKIEDKTNRMSLETIIWQFWSLKKRSRKISTSVLTFLIVLTLVIVNRSFKSIKDSVLIQTLLVKEIWVINIKMCHFCHKTLT